MSSVDKGLDIVNFADLNSTSVRGGLLTILEQAFIQLDPLKLLDASVKEVLADSRDFRNVYVIGFGKAALKMYRGVRGRTISIARYSAIIIPTGEAVPENYPELEILVGNHPIPSTETLSSSRKILGHLGNLSEDDLVIVLISGGGSALFEIPEGGFTIKMIGDTAKCLMESGADINELNAIRQAMSSVKGGKLAKILYPSEVYGLIISDVPGDDPAVIASGPLTRPSLEPGFLGKVVEKYRETCMLPSKEELERHFGNIEPGSFRHVTTRIILKNSDFVNLISTLISKNGDTVVTLADSVTGDVVDAAKWFAERMRKQFAVSRKPIWIVGGGETTAKVRGNGKGGRNCELSLRVAMNMESDEDFLFASIGTDGIDGASPAMGGITDNYFLEGLGKDEIFNSLAISDSYTLLNKYNSAIITGYTGTNVSDIYIAYYGGKRNK